MALSGSRDSRRCRLASFTAASSASSAVAHRVMVLVAAAQSLQDLNRLVHRRLLDDDLLEPPRQRAVLLDVLVLLEGRRADHAQLAGREHRLDQRREIERPAGGRPRADRGVNLVDEEDRLRALGQGGNHRLEALLEVAAEARARQQRRRVERVDLGALQRLRDVGVEQAHRQPLGHRGLADARIADEHRVVLPAPAQHLERPLELQCSADERIEVAGARPRRQADGVGAQRIAGRGRAFLARCRPGARLSGSARPVRGRHRHLRHAVRDVVEHVEPGDALIRPAVARRTRWAAGAAPRAGPRLPPRSCRRSGRAAPPSGGPAGTRASGRARVRGRARTARRSSAGTGRDRRGAWAGRRRRPGGSSRPPGRARARTAGAPRVRWAWRRATASRYATLKRSSTEALNIESPILPRGWPAAESPARAPGRARWPPWFPRCRTGRGRRGPGRRRGPAS